MLNTFGCVFSLLLTGRLVKLTYRVTWVETKPVRGGYKAPVARS